MSLTFPSLDIDGIRDDIFQFHEGNSRFGAVGSLRQQNPPS